MLCLKKRRTYSFTQGACADLPRRSKKDNNRYEGSLNMAITTLPRKNRSREERPSRMVLTVTEDTPADMLAGSMELLVQLPREHHLHTQRVTVQRSTPMMDLLVQIATAHKLAASSYTLQAIGERGLVLPHQPNTPIGALDALQVKLLPKQGTFVPRKTRQANQPFETTFRLQVHLPRNQLYVSRVSPKMNLGDILDEVCREKNLDRNKYELRHPANLEETLDLSLSLQDYHLQEVTLYAKQGRTLGSALSSQDIMALQRQEERRRQQAKQSVFGFMFKKSKESSLSTDSLGGRSVSPARSDETGRSASPLQPPARPQRKRRPAPKPPVQTPVAEESPGEGGKDKMVISHSRNSSDSSGYHEASVLSDNPESARLPETLPRRSRPPGAAEVPRKLAHTSQSSKSLGNLATTSSALSHGTSSTSLSSTDSSGSSLRKKRAAPPPPPAPRPLSSAVSTQALERIVDSEESLTSDMDHSKPPSDIGAPSKASSDIDDYPKASSDVGVASVNRKFLHESAPKAKSVANVDRQRETKPNIEIETGVKDTTSTFKSAIPEAAADDASNVDTARVAKRAGEPAPLPKPRKVNLDSTVSTPPKPPKRRVGPPTVLPRSLSKKSDSVDSFSRTPSATSLTKTMPGTPISDNTSDMSPASDNVFNMSPMSHSSDEGNVFTTELQKLEMRSEKPLEAINANINDAKMATTKERRSDRDDAIYMHRALSLEFMSKYGNPEETSNVDEEAEDSVKDTRRASETKLRVNDTEVETFERSESGKQDTSGRYRKQAQHNSHKSSGSLRQFKTPSLTHARSLDDVRFSPGNRTPTDSSKNSPRRSPAYERKLCSVISTIPKCDHIDVIGKDEVKSSPKKSNDARSTTNDRENEPASFNEEEIAVEPIVKLDADNIENAEAMRAKVKQLKRSKVLRSQSELNDFETDELNRHRRHLTSYTEDIAFAINLNLSTDVGFLSEELASDNDRENRREEMAGTVNGTEAEGAVGISDNEASPSETDILLQKVSDTLSNSLPASKAPAVPALSRESKKTTIKVETPKITEITKKNETTSVPEKLEAPLRAKEEKKSTREDDVVDGTVLKASTPNITAASQQDTSDYVSAVDEDLSISDWEYQLPAPPSAFRDTNSPVFDGYDTITLRSVEAFKEPDPVEDKGQPAKERGENEVQNVRTSDDRSAKNAKSEMPVQKAPSAETRRPVSAEKSLPSAELKKEVISELESKIETGTLPQSTNKEADSKKVEKSSTPKIAPVDNTLSNFTITTYPRQKNIDIFDDVEKAPSAAIAKRMEERMIKTVAKNETISDRTDVKSPAKKFTSAFDESHNVKKNTVKEEASVNVKSVERKKVETKIHKQESMRKPESVSAENEKVNVQRSKSYISMTGNEKYKNTREENNESAKYDTDGGMKKSTSINNLNADVPRSNEKFSNWRDNILKRQEEPTKEKQLQSLQVLKSILPQLKNAQQAEESVLTEISKPTILEDTRHKSGSNEHSAETNAVLTREQVTSKSETKPAAPNEASKKRYTYAGPPMINLGSWSERPSSNVQIKMDTDYKFGRSNVTGGKTIVNIYDSDYRNRDVNIADNVSKQTERNNMKNELATKDMKVDSLPVDKKEPDELTRKLITHTTASGFKKPSSTKVSINDMKSMSRQEDKPVVTAVELKKASNDRQGSTIKDSGNEIDTTPVNFRELTKAFGQDICLRAKPKRMTAHRHSDYGIGQMEPTESIPEYNTRQNGHVTVNNKLDDTDVAQKSQTLASRGQGSANFPNKRFTSVVGIQTSNHNTLPHNGTFAVRNGTTTTRINTPMPIVKGFKMQTASTEPKASNVYVNQNGTTTDVNKNVPNMPKPPTMPVITGVTLKSASGRPKSMPVNVDSRDTLLESIRNFGGREKLKSATTRY